MSKLSREQVLKLAQLSKLKLSDDEVAQYQEELSKILEYVEQLEGVNVDGLKPAYQVSGLSTVTRKDEIQDYQAKPEHMLQNAPKSKDGYVQVGRMI